MAEFKYKPLLQKHTKRDRSPNIEAVIDSEMFYIFGDRAYISGYHNPDNDTKELIALAKELKKPFILAIDSSLLMRDQIFLRDLCPPDNTQVFSFDPEPYQSMDLHRKMQAVLDWGISTGLINDPDKET